MSRGEATIRHCSICNQEVRITSVKRRNLPKVYCSRKCSGQASLKITWPTMEEVLSMVNETSFEEVGRSLEVAANSVRKYLRRNGIDPKEISFKKSSGLLYQGRRVVRQSKLYPAVLWPDHPMASKNGYVFVHRAVAYEKYGDIPDGYHVHHKDHNTWNWDADNLELMEASAHLKMHSALKKRDIIVYCCHCGKEKKIKPCYYKGGKKFYCDLKCFHESRRKIEWPTVDEVVRMVKETSFAEVGRQLGVAGSSVRKYLERSGINPKSVLSSHDRQAVK